MTDGPEAGPRIDTPPEVVRYRVDATDRLIAFNQAWDEFAEENGAPWLRGADLAGHSLWEYVAAPEIQQIFRVLLGRVRSGRKALALPFRCDAPALRRHMEMEIRPLPDNQLEFCCRLLRVEPRDPVVLDRSRSRDPVHRLLRMCSWCNRFDVGGGKWEEIENAAAQVDLFGAVHPAFISHGICDECLDLLEGNEKKGGAPPP